MTGRTWAVAALTATVLAVSVPQDAGAAVTATTARDVTVTSRTVTLTATAHLTPRMTARGPLEDYRATAWAATPSGWVEVGAGRSTTPTVTIRARVTARTVGVGPVALWIMDEYDYSGRFVSFTVRRLSRVAVTHAEARPGGRVAVAVRVTHYDPAVGGFVGSRRSPVRIQAWTGRAWATVATVTTTADGLAGAIVTGRPGRNTFRAVRLTGSTVTAATSGVVRVNVPGVGC